MAWAPLKYGTPLAVRQEGVPEINPPSHDLMPNGGADLDKAKHLLGVCQTVMEGSSELTDFVDKNRKLSRDVGIETIAIELAGIIDGGRLGDVRVLLDNGVKTGNPMMISPELEGRIRRGQSLLAEASNEISKGTGISPSNAKKIMGQDEGIGLFWVPFVAVAAVAIGVAIYAYKPAPAVTSPLPKSSPKIGSRVFMGSSRPKHKA